jgi:diadenylate cyclase
MIQKISVSCERLSRTATGALIVIECQTKLGEQIDTGTILNANTSAELLCNIFFKNSPLHDGAMIMRGGRIYAAGCYLPKPQKEEFIGKELGTRHRAAIGITEVSDSVVIVVSEETGNISIAENGELTRNFDKNKLYNYLYKKFIDNNENKMKNKKGSHGND